MVPSSVRLGIQGRQCLPPYLNNHLDNRQIFLIIVQQLFQRLFLREIIEHQCFRRFFQGKTIDLQFFPHFFSRQIIEERFFLHFFSRQIIEERFFLHFSVRPPIIDHSVVLTRCTAHTYIPSNIPVHNQVISGIKTKSQEHLNIIDKWTDRQR